MQQRVLGALVKTQIQCESWSWLKKDMPGNMLIEEFRKIHGVRHCQSVHNQIMLQSWHDGPLAEIMVVPCLLACMWDSVSPSCRLQRLTQTEISTCGIGIAQQFTTFQSKMCNILRNIASLVWVSSNTILVARSGTAAMTARTTREIVIVR